jgi:hypothetical protein
MTIAPEQAGLVIAAMIIIVVIMGVVFLSFGGFDSLTEWISGFGKTKGERLCENINGEWCKGFLECKQGQLKEVPKDYDGEWKCCELGECLSKDQIGKITKQEEERNEDIEIKSFSIIGGGETVNVLEKIEAGDTIILDYGTKTPYEVEFTIESPDKEIVYDLRIIQRSGEWQLTTGKATAQISKRVGLSISPGDDALVLSVWHPSSKNKKDTKPVTLNGRLPKGYEFGKPIRDEEFNKDVYKSKKGDIFYVFGTGIVKNDRQSLSTVLEIELGGTYDDKLQKEWFDRCRSSCELSAGCIIPILSYTNCLFCKGGSSEAEDIEFECLDKCINAGKCESHHFVGRTYDGKTCSPLCEYSYTEVADFKIETVKDNNLIRADKDFLVYIWKNSRWQQLDCSGAGECDMETETVRDSDSFTEALQKCIKYPDYDIC